MPKSLSDIQIKNIKKLGNHRVGPSLYIHVKQERKLWYLRQTIDDKRKWIYIGTYPAISPKEAREKAAALLSSDQAPQAVLREEKRTKVESAIRAEKQGKTFKEVAEEYISEIKTEEWTAGAKTGGDFRSH